MPERSTTVDLESSVERWSTGMIPLPTERRGCRSLINGEHGGAARFGNFSQIRKVAELVMPGVGLSTLFRRFRGAGGGSPPLVEPGTYTLTLAAGEHTASQPITVERIGAFEGETAPFESNYERY